MTNFKEAGDNDLLELLKEDDLNAFKEIYQRYWKKIYATAFKRLKRKELAEEIVQELFVGLWVKRHNREIHSCLSSYLYSSVSHYIIDCYRKESVRQKYTENLKVAQDSLKSTVEADYELKELSDNIEKGVLQLPDKCRSVFEMSRKEFKSNKEIAVQLGISEKTVENHLTKAIKRLRLSLSNFLF